MPAPISRCPAKREALPADDLGEADLQTIAGAEVPNRYHDLDREHEPVRAGHRSGLMVHQMGGFDPERLRLASAIPETFQPMAMMAIGYQLPESRIPEGVRLREYAPRSRRRLAESFFLGEWGRPGP
ncbi:MAG: hypothetical protein ACREXX_14580 [Gammaproteobacteria bacterium]